MAQQKLFYSSRVKSRLGSHVVRLQSWRSFGIVNPADDKKRMETGMGSETKNTDVRVSALFSQGFRPFFLFGSIYTALTVFLWVPAFEGRSELLTIFVPVDWHIHEMLFGFLPAVMTGFLLTAIPNWTGQPPISGRPLLLLFLLWVTGRFAVMMSALIGFHAAMVADCGFLLAVVLVAGREIVASRNWRNLKVLLPLLLLLTANILFHYEANFQGLADYSRRLGLSAALMLIMLIGGRVIPNFTQNWLTKENPGRLPVSFNLSDLIIVLLSIVALMLWTALPSETITGALMLIAGGLNAYRLTRWAGYRTSKNPLVLYLHIAYLFIPLGFLLIGATIVWWVDVQQAAGIHALGAGAIGLMMLAVMIRATLGHTDQPLVAGVGEQVIFAGVVVSTLCRVVGGLEIWPSASLIHLSGLIWACSFFGFALLHISAMFTPVAKKPGAKAQNGVPSD